MSKADDLIHTIELIYAAGLNAERWPDALTGVTRAVGGVAATLEVIDRHTLRHVEFHSFGLPRPEEIEYLDHYAPLNPRLPFVSRQGAGEFCWDYRIFDERMMGRTPFYAEFLPQMGLRYFVDALLAASARDFSAIVVHRSPAQGHIDKPGLATLERLVPHVRGAFDMATRLKGAEHRTGAFEHALDLLADGVMFVDADGKVTHANETMQEIARRGDGIRIIKSQIEFASTDARLRFNEALGQIGRLRSGTPDARGCDFAVLRDGGVPPYIVSVRPLTRRGNGIHDSNAHALVFVHDPLKKKTSIIRALRDAFALTKAEAALAEALQSGAPLFDYARDKRLSLNTVYTHLRRVKEKTGSARLPDLIHKLNDLRVRIRSG